MNYTDSHKADPCEGLETGNRVLTHTKGSSRGPWLGDGGEEEKDGLKVRSRRGSAPLHSGGLFSGGQRVLDGQAQGAGGPMSNGAQLLHPPFPWR